MSLTLAMLRCPDSVAPETRTVAGGEYSIGRAPENDWVLPDPERALSKRHCVLAYLAGGWQVADLSTNGTFLNREAEPIGRGRGRELRGGDRLSFGAYEIEVHIEEEGLAPRRTTPADPFAAHRSATPELFALDPFAPPPAARTGVRPPDPLLDEGGAHRLGPDAAGASGRSPCRRTSTRSPLKMPSARSAARPSRIILRISGRLLATGVATVLPDDWDREKSQPGIARLVRPEPEPVAFRRSQARPRRHPSRFVDPAAELAPSEARHDRRPAPPRSAPARIAARRPSPCGPGIE